MLFKELRSFFSNRIADPGLKEQFDRETKVLSLRMLRYTCLIGIILFPLFGVLDVVVFPRLIPVFWGLRIFEVAFCALIYIAAGSRLIREHPATAGMILMIVSCLDIVAMCWLTGGPASLYYAGINLTILVVIFVMVLDARRVLLACGVVYLAFMLPLFIGWPPAAVPSAASSAPPAIRAAMIVSNNFFLLTTMALGVLWTILKNRSRLENLIGRRNLAQVNEELKRLDELKSQFFTNVSHEVRTPLTSIIGPIESFYLGDAGPLTADQRTLVESAYRNSFKLLDLINQMLDFAKIEAGKMPLRLLRADLSRVLNDIVSSFRPVAARKGIALEFRSIGDIPPVFIDEEKFERIVTNLVRNALKFTEKGSITLTLEAAGGRIVLTVEDTGIGIAPEHLSRLFERFHQADGTSTRRYEGTGIGLTIVKEYVDLMFGRISVSSEPGRGTRFQIDLPANLPELAPDALLERRAPHPDQPDHPDASLRRRRDDLARVTLNDLARIDLPASSMPISPAPTSSSTPAPDAEAEASQFGDRVLLAEDNADLRSYLRTMLTKVGHNVTAVSDGQEAWEAVGRDRPDIIVSDIMMPRMDGYELLERVKNSPETLHLPVILITAKPELEARLKGFEGGADAYMCKPVNIRELDARIRNLVTERRLRQTVFQIKEMESRNEERRRGFERLRLALKSTVQAMASVVDMRSPYTAGHQRRMAELARAIGAEMGLSEDQLEGLHTAAMIHDIGVIHVPGEILNKPAKLTQLEFELVMTHVQSGAEILKGIDFPWPIGRMILEHHERIDGSGYPNGVKGENLLIESRVLAVADVVEAMSMHRPHRPALGIEAALAEITANKGVLYDPDVVNACIRLFKEKNFTIGV